MHGFVNGTIHCSGVYLTECPAYRYLECGAALILPADATLDPRPCCAGKPVSLDSTPPARHSTSGAHLTAAGPVWYKLSGMIDLLIISCVAVGTGGPQPWR